MDEEKGFGFSAEEDICAECGEPLGDERIHLNSLDADFCSEECRDKCLRKPMGPE